MEKPNLYKGKMLSCWFWQVSRLRDALICILDHKQSELGIGLSSYAVVLLVLPLVSLMTAKFTSLSECCFIIIIAYFFSFVHILLSNILSVYYSTWTSHKNITILRKYSGNGCACASSQYQAAINHLTLRTEPA